jgi:RNA polymerase sigma-70 factor (ECF subfamily)
MSQQDSIFEERRGAMTGLAYRMLGSRADAEDVVQDAWIRWRGVAAGEVANPAGFLNKVVTRLCLDRLKSARARREVYVGEWLPEPVVDDDHERLGEDLSVAFLLALERLTPLERAAFLLHDVFDLPFAEVAKTLGRGEAACRQLAARAREHVKAGKPRYRPTAEEEQRLTSAFLTAALSGDESLLQLEIHAPDRTQPRAQMAPSPIDHSKPPTAFATNLICRSRRTRHPSATRSAIASPRSG